uniref:Uncharacterized protein n=1 Tax=Rhizophora mucronata TaxID=61149 RepID=A0A2P2N499_RHIMU
MSSIDFNSCCRWKTTDDLVSRVIRGQGANDKHEHESRSIQWLPW